MTAPKKPKPAGKRITVRLDATTLQYAEGMRMKGESLSDVVRYCIRQGYYGR